MDPPFTSDQDLEVNTSALAPCSIDQLPDELLCLIFWFAGHLERLACTRVCSRWREASLAAPSQLWRKIKSHNQVRGAFAGLMDRSGNAPVKVRVEIKNCNVSEVAAALKKHMHHVVSLLVHLDQQLDVETSGLQLADALSCRAPLLETFIVMDVFRSVMLGLAACQQTLFSDYAPALSCFKLYGDLSCLGQCALTHIKHLLFSPSIAPMDIDVLLYCFHCVPKLETMGIQLLSWEQIDEIQISLPPSLRALVVTSESEDFNPVHVLKSLRFSNLPKLTVAFDVGCTHEIAREVLEHVLRTLETPFVDITIDSSTYSELSLIECKTRAGQEREFLDMPTALPNDMFSSLVSLSISEWEWNDAVKLPPAPVLTRLTVRLVTPHYIAHDGHKSLFLELGANNTRLECPMLHTLVFSTRKRGDPALLGFSPALSPEMIRAFIQHKLDHGQSKVPVLCLNGVRILENVIDEVVALLACVEEIEWGPGHFTPDSDVQHLHDWK